MMTLSRVIITRAVVLTTEGGLDMAKDMFEDSKGIIRSRKSKERQYNC
jgi:hypothetical protein